jgi:hypothetical protein
MVDFLYLIPPINLNPHRWDCKDGTRGKNKKLRKTQQTKSGIFPQGEGIQGGTKANQGAKKMNPCKKNSHLKIKFAVA